MYTDQYPGGSQSISEGFVHFKFRGYIIGDIRAIRQEGGILYIQDSTHKASFCADNKDSGDNYRSR